MKKKAAKKKEQQDEFINIEEKIREIEQIKQLIKETSTKVKKMKDLFSLDPADQCIMITKLYYNSEKKRRNLDNRGGDHKSETFRKKNHEHDNADENNTLDLEQDITLVSSFSRKKLVFLLLKVIKARSIRTLQRRNTIGRGILNHELDLITILNFKKKNISQAEVLRRLKEKELLPTCKSCTHARLSACPYCKGPVLQCAKKHVFTLHEITRTPCRDFEY